MQARCDHAISPWIGRGPIASGRRTNNWPLELRSARLPIPLGTKVNTHTFLHTLVGLATALIGMQAFGATPEPDDAAPIVGSKPKPLLEALADLDGRVQAVLPPGLARRVVRTRSSELPDREALVRMLQGWSYVLYPIEVSGAGRTPRWRLLIVSAPEDGADGGGVEPSRFPSLAGGPTEAPMSNAVPSIPDLLAEAGAAALPEQRAKALETLAYQGREEAKDGIGLALADADPNVRAKALEVLKDTADEVPVDLLAGLAQGDAEPMVRAQALALLAERAEDQASPVLETALSDPAPEVRQLARELIEDRGGQHAQLDID